MKSLFLITSFIFAFSLRISAADEATIQQRIKQFQSSSSRTKGGYRDLLQENEVIRKNQPLYYANAASLFAGWMEHRDPEQELFVGWQEWLPAVKAVLETDHAEAQRTFQGAVAKGEGMGDGPLSAKATIAITMLRWSKPPSREVAETAAELLARLYEELPRDYSKIAPPQVLYRIKPTDFEYKDKDPSVFERASKEQAAALERWEYYKEVYRAVFNVSDWLERYFEAGLGYKSLTPDEIKRIKAIYSEKIPAPLRNEQ